MEERSVVADDGEVDDDSEYEYEDEDASDNRHNTGRLISIGLIVLLVLGAIWFAWTRFGSQIRKP